MTNTMSCGCEIISDNLGVYKIEYCPKHRASPKMHTIKEIKDGLIVSDRTVRRWIADGKLKRIKIQGVVRIKDEEYKRFLEESER